MWVEILVLFLCGGMVGGTLAALQYADVAWLIRDNDRIVWRKAPSVAFGLLISAAGGIGGAAAALFLMLADGKITDVPLTNVTRLLYPITAVVAGFLGLRLLKYVANRFDESTRKTAEAQAKKTAHKVIEEKLQEEQRQRRRVEAINLGRLVQIENSNGKAKLLAGRAAKELEALVAEFPGDREVNGILGWLYANPLGRLPDAVGVLTKSIDHLRTHKPAPALIIDLSDFFYNRACYHARLAIAGGYPATKTGPAKDHADKALQDLDESCELQKENWKYATETDELKEFKKFESDPEYAKLKQKYQ